MLGVSRTLHDWIYYYNAQYTYIMTKSQSSVCGVRRCSGQGRHYSVLFFLRQKPRHVQRVLIKPDILYRLRQIHYNKIDLTYTVRHICINKWRVRIYLHGTLTSHMYILLWPNEFYLCIIIASRIIILYTVSDRFQITLKLAQYRTMY